MTYPLKAFYELLASGQLEVPVGVPDQLEAWLAKDLPPGTPIGAWAKTEALGLEPHLVAQHDITRLAPFSIWGRHGHCWGGGATWQEAWLEALVSCWRTIAWRARRDQVLARLIERGLRRAA